MFFEKCVFLSFLPIKPRFLRGFETLNYSSSESLMSPILILGSSITWLITFT